jgi:uncharacterized protein (TIGR01370 family)
MSRMLAGGFAALLAVAVLAACSGVHDGLQSRESVDRADVPSQPERADRTDRAARLAQACTWAPIHGGTGVRGAGAFDVVVVDAIAQRNGFVETSKAEVRKLQEEGTLVLAYLSVGTVERWRHYAADVPRSWTLGAVDGWPGERFVDAGKAGWRSLMAREARTLAAAGVDGLYLDNLDVAELHPRTATGIVTLVEGIAAAAPDLLLVAQNGLAVADRLPIDGISHEDVFWRWDGRYRRSSAAERAELLPRLRALRDRGAPVFTLDYAKPGSAGADEAVAASLAEGFHPAVSVLALDRLPHGVPRDC